MMRYSVQPRDWIFLKDHGFLSFAKNKGRNIVKTCMINTARNFLIMLNNLQQMHLKLLHKG